MAYLKIKDNVDLKELKKFGFVNRDFCYEYLSRDGNFKIYINQANEISFDISKKCKDISKVQYMLIVLYDLIQAGFIKKDDDYKDFEKCFKEEFKKFQRIPMNKTSDSVWGNTVVRINPKTEEIIRNKLQTWEVKIKIERAEKIESVVNRALNEIKIFEERKIAGEKAPYTCYQLADWTLLRQENGDIIYGDTIIFVKYAIILEDL